MGREGLFDDLPEFDAGKPPAGEARMRSPERDQTELRVVDCDSLIGRDHPARIIWAFVEKLDLRALEAAIKARTHTPGQAPPNPRLLLALWLYATSQGVGSARALAKLCVSHDAYRWLCGGVSVNYHGLSDFRSGHGALLDQLLTEHVASLSAAGVIDLDEVVQDGVRVRASAGAASFRRSKKLYKEMKKASRLVERLKGEIDDDPDASNRRIQAARERAAREGAERVAKALSAQRELQAERERRAEMRKKKDAAKQKEKELRVSTTDPEARIMKMPDGGFRPAYNCQIGTVAQGQIVVDVAAATSGSDRGQMRAMTERLNRRFGRMPDRQIVDGGFHKNDDIEWAAQNGVKVYCPAVPNKHGTDRYAPRHDDGPGVAAWRQRMNSPHGKGVYKRRAMGECINARFRNWRLQQFAVRGIAKVTMVLRLYALANNILAGHRLMMVAAS